MRREFWLISKTSVRCSKEVLKSVDLIRFEVHGPAAELETLKEPLAKLKPKWFVHQCSLAVKRVTSGESGNCVFVRSTARALQTF